MSPSSGAVMTRREIKEAAERHAARLADMRARHLAASRHVERLRHLIDRRLPSNAERRARWAARQADEEGS